MKIDETAPIITRDEISITASLDKVWDLFTDISHWPDWNKEIADVSLDSPLDVGVTFHWSTAGMNIASTVGELAPMERIAWSGEVMGIMGIHVWKFTSAGVETVVNTEESWSGGPVEQNSEFFQNALDASIRSWLESLKRAIE